MESKDLLESSFDCVFGKQHTVPADESVYADDSFGLIPRLIGTYSPEKRCLIIADNRTSRGAGRELNDLCESSGTCCSVVQESDFPTIS